MDAVVSRGEGCQSGNEHSSVSSDEEIDEELQNAIERISRLYNSIEDPLLVLEGIVSAKDFSNHTIEASLDGAKDLVSRMEHITSTAQFAFANEEFKSDMNDFFSRAKAVVQALESESASA